MLVQGFIRRFNRELGTQITAIDPDVFTALARHSWPGNIRELQSVLRQAMLRGSAGCLRLRHLPEHWNASVIPGADLPPRPTPEPIVGQDLERFVRERLAAGSQTIWEDVKRIIDQQLLTIVLDECGGSQAQAAVRLGVARQTLRSRLRELRLWPTNNRSDTTE